MVFHAPFGRQFAGLCRVDVGADHDAFEAFGAAANTSGRLTAMASRYGGRGSVVAKRTPRSPPSTGVDSTSRVVAIATSSCRTVSSSSPPQRARVPSRSIATRPTFVPTKSRVPSCDTVVVRGKRPTGQRASSTPESASRATTAPPKKSVR